MLNAEGQFLEDTGEVLSTLEQNLLLLDQHKVDQDLYDAIFRELHTVKGSLLMFDRKQLGDLAHKTESAFEEFKSFELPVSLDVIQLTLNIVDFIQTTMHLPELESNDHISILDSLSGSLTVACDDALRHVEHQRKRKEVEQSIYFLQIRPARPIAAGDGHPIHYIIRDLVEDANAHEFLQTGTDKEVRWWNVLLISDLNQQEIESLFLFIEDDVQLDISKYPIAEANAKGISLALFSTELKEESPEPLKQKLASFVEQIAAQDAQKDDKKHVIPTHVKGLDSNFIKVERSKIDGLMNWVSELVTLQATLQNEAEMLKSETLRDIADSLDLVTENLRDTIFSVSLVPLKSLEARFTRLVRDLSLSLGKEIVFSSTGFETELDKKVISSLADPLLHILRNCIDHGIESPEERSKEGKVPSGTIHLKSYYSGNLVFIEIEDDGAGIDPNKIRAKAMELGLLDVDADVTDDEIMQFIFHPGLSTTDEINDISGRGVGMDVVKKKIQELRGEVWVSSELGVGTKTTIKLPLSLSILEGLHTKVGGTNMVIPLNTIREIHRFDREDFYSRPNGSNILEFEGKQLSVVSIADKLSMDSSKAQTVDVITINVGSMEKGVAVDEIKGQVKAVLKPISDYYEAQDFISGVTILGDGKLAFVLDMEKIIN